MKTTQLTLLILVILPASTSAQILASYDHLAGPQELAKVACPHAPVPLSATRQLPHPPGIPWTWWFGGFAADNGNHRYRYWANGHPIDEIQRLRVDLIALGAPPFSFLTPPGFNQVTGMTVDPRYPAGRILWMTDGFDIVQYQVPPHTAPGTYGVILAGPIPVPLCAGGVRATGLVFDPWTQRILVVDDASTIYPYDLMAGWQPPVPPAVAVPIGATGIAVCLDVPDDPWVCYFGGAVRQPATGAALAFPPAPGPPVRHHHGLAFIARPMGLGGAGVTRTPPTVLPRGTPVSGNMAFGLELQAPADGMAIAAISPEPAASWDLGPVGILHLDPAALFIVGSAPPGTSAIVPLPLTVPPGLRFVFQAVVPVDALPPVLSNATHVTVCLWD